MLILLAMIFCHIVDDYYLQGILASFKQKKWWKENASQELYKNDYIMALLEHAFSWSFMIHVPLIASMIFHNDTVGCALLISVLANTVIHAFIDNLKANKLKINLIQDQLLHLFQIMITLLVFMLFILN